MTNFDEMVAAALKLDATTRRTVVERIAAGLDETSDSWLPEATARAREAEIFPVGALAAGHPAARPRRAGMRS